VQEIGGGARRFLGPIDEDCVPRWSPDGKRIAYVRKSGDGFELVTTTPAASQLRPVTRIGTPDGSFRAVNPFMLSWAVDGTAVVFSESAGGREPFSLIWVSVTSGSRRRLTWPLRAATETQPAFSPDGRWLRSNPTTPGPTSYFVRLRLAKGAAEPQLLYQEAMHRWVCLAADVLGWCRVNRENGHMALQQLSLCCPKSFAAFDRQRKHMTFPSSVHTE
jgi:dipeptidyl aminopeptidase/acylaminoacyl peptidase